MCAVEAQVDQSQDSDTSPLFQLSAERLRQVDGEVTKNENEITFQKMKKKTNLFH
jgi:hypothetical protein